MGVLSLLASSRPMYVVLVLTASVVTLGLCDKKNNRTYGENFTVYEELLPGLTEEIWGDDVLVDTNYGQLRGRTRVGYPEAGGSTSVVNWFLGIPYAEPPTGEKRFKPPQAPASWSGVRNATRLGSTCPQNPYGPDTYREVQNEDCLYLNVYSPVMPSDPNATPKDQKVPVYVFLHGGSYKYGSGSAAAGHVLAQQGIVVVTINYRLGLLGFMTTLNDTLPGNYGFLDMVRALKWINENIQFFGGDPDKVTVGGHSAGGPAASLLALSPLAKGLLHQILINSGPPLAFWAMHNETVNLLGQAQDLSKVFGCGNLPVPAMVDCMMTKPWSLISNDTVYPRYSPTGTDLKPHVEAGAIPAMPKEMLVNGAINIEKVMMGTVQNEWNFLMTYFYYDVAEAQHIDTDFSDGMDRDSFIKALTNAITVRFGWPRTVLDAVIQEYTDWTKVNDTMENYKQYSEFNGGMSFYAPTVETARLFQSRGVPVFMYEFDHRPEHDPLGISGVYHYLDVNDIFGCPFTKVHIELPQWLLNYTDTDRRVSAEMMTLVGNFVKFGDPTPSVNNSVLGALKWEEYQPETADYLHISPDVNEMREHFKTDRAVFINQFIPSLLMDSEDGGDKPCDDKDDDDDDDDDDDYELEMWIFIGVSIGLLLLVIILIACLVHARRMHSVDITN